MLKSQCSLVPEYTSKVPLFPKTPGKPSLLPMMFLELRKLGNICCGHKMFLNKIRNIFCVPDTNLCPQQMLCARANGEWFVSETMCPRLPRPLARFTSRGMAYFHLGGLRFTSVRTTIYICADYDLHLGGLRFTSRHTMIIHLDVTWKSCTLKTNSELRGINL